MRNAERDPLPPSNVSMFQSRTIPERDWGEEDFAVSAGTAINTDRAHNTPASTKHTADSMIRLFFMLYYMPPPPFSYPAFSSHSLFRGK